MGVNVFEVCSPETLARANFFQAYSISAGLLT